MDIYTNPPKFTYVTGITKLFTMPTDSGGIPAVAVTKKTAVYITSTYTILIILIFMIGWNLIIAIIMAFWDTDNDPNRQTALVALWNSGESLNAFALMLDYCKRMLHYMMRAGAPEEKPSDVENPSDPTDAGQGSAASRDSIRPANGEKNGTQKGPPESIPKCGARHLLWGLLFAFIALAMTAGNVVAGILVPVQLSMGHVAPPAKDVIFYPDVQAYARTDDNDAGKAKLNSLRAPSALRSIGSIESSKVTVRERLKVDVTTEGNNSHAVYNYTITGVDMGLQTDPHLELRVGGECHTDPTWLQSSNDTQETYSLFGGSQTFVLNHQPLTNFPPMANFIIDTNTGGQETSNTSYAIIINTGGLYSYTNGQDPWYLTEKAGVNGAIAYRVRRERPALRCWEVSRWHLGGKNVDVNQLSELPGLKLDKFWINDVFPYEFGAPRVLMIGVAAGTSALKSASYAMAPSYILDAGASTIKADLERLLLAGWVSSRNVLGDTTTYDKGNMQNKAEGGGGSVAVSSAKFVLQSGDVETLSVRILIAVPAILLFLFLFEKGLVYWLRNHTYVGEKCIIAGEDKSNNAVVLVSTQLFRKVDEEINKRQWEDKKKLIPFLPLSGTTPTGQEQTAGKGLDGKSGATHTQTQVDPE